MHSRRWWHGSLLLCVVLSASSRGAQPPGTLLTVPWPFSVSLLQFVLLRSKMIPLVSCCFTVGFSHSFVAVIGGTGFITAVRWKGMIKTKGERQENAV